MGQMHLGRCYLKGKGVEKSQNLAVSWLEKAANAGEADACHDFLCTILPEMMENI